VKKSLLFMFVLVAALSSLASHAVTFTCSSNSPLAEALICKDEKLSAKDDEMAAIYRVLRKRPVQTMSGGGKTLKNEQLEWLSFRNSCNNIACLNKAYDDRISELNEFKSNSYNVPVSPPICIETAISFLGGRLQNSNPKETGSVVHYQNGIAGRGYGYVPAVSKRSRVGDQVKVCWIWKEVNCPSGEKGTNVYRTTNLRTGEQWELPEYVYRCSSP
jgi:uncharacterized protein